MNSTITSYDRPQYGSSGLVRSAPDLSKDIIKESVGSQYFAPHSANH